jgi:Myb-like DNA-binding protein FlbD
MVKRQKWLELEDKKLEILIKDNVERDWDKVAKDLEAFKIYKNGKQCRQRWDHHLNPDLSKKKWSLEDNKKLFDLHQKFGNKWKVISEYFPGRTDNIIKNQFFSLVRKGLRISRKMLGKNSNTEVINKIKPKALSQFISKSILVDIPISKNLSENKKISKKKISINHFLRKYAFKDFKEILNHSEKYDKLIIKQCIKMLITINNTYERTKKDKITKKYNTKNNSFDSSFDSKATSQKGNFSEQLFKLLQDKNRIETNNKNLLSCENYKNENKNGLINGFLELEKNIANIIDVMKNINDEEFKEFLFQKKNKYIDNSFDFDNLDNLINNNYHINELQDNTKKNNEFLLESLKTKKIYISKEYSRCNSLNSNFFNVSKINENDINNQFLKPPNLENTKLQNFSNNNIFDDSILKKQLKKQISMSNTNTPRFNFLNFELEKTYKKKTTAEVSLHKKNIEFFSEAYNEILPIQNENENKIYVTNKNTQDDNNDSKDNQKFINLSLLSSKSIQTP